MVHNSEEEALKATSHLILQLNAVISPVNNLSTSVDSFANPDNEGHGDPLARAVADLIPLCQNLISFHHHKLLNDHSIGLIVFELILVAVLRQLFIFLSAYLPLSKLNCLLLLHYEESFRFLSVKLVYLEKILLFAIHPCIVISCPFVGKLVKRC